MKNIPLDTSIGELVRAAPIRARVFEQLGIDYCCGGKKTLAEVCHTKRLDALTVATMLSALDQAPLEASANPDALSLSELCDHIETVHHQYLRDELPRLDFMTRKVAAVHGEHEPRLREIREVFESLAPELASHIVKEEDTVFPQIRELDKSADRSTAAESLRAALDELEHEHDGAGDALARLHTLTDRYTPPEWACNTFRALYDGLARLEQNMHQHVHKENNILFPRALALG